MPPPTIKEETPEAVTAEAAEQPAEPEVIGKSKKAEEGEAAEGDETKEKGKEREKEKEKKRGE